MSQDSESVPTVSTIDAPASLKITLSAPTHVHSSQQDQRNGELVVAPLEASLPKETPPPKSQQSPCLSKEDLQMQLNVLIRRDNEQPKTESTQPSTMSSEASKKKSFCCNCLIDLDSGLIATFTNEDPNKNTSRPGYCKETFESAQELKSHQRDHTGEKPYKCPECEQRFSSRVTRREHLKAAHQIQRLIPCKRESPEVVQITSSSVTLSSARKAAKTSSGLASTAVPPQISMENELSKRGMKNFQGLSLLGNNYESLLTTRSMMMQTPDPRPGFRYICPYCDKNNYSTQQLEVHIRTHTGEKPYNCRFCKITFTQKGNRNTHEKKYHMEQYIEAYRTELMQLGRNHPAAIDLLGPPPPQRTPVAYGTMGFGPGQYMPLGMLQKGSNGVLQVENPLARR